MGKNKSARHREARRARIAKLYQPQPGNSKLPPVRMGNVDYEVIKDLAEKNGVQPSKILCGYVRQPIDYSGSDHRIIGHCALGEDLPKCEYAIPLPADTPVSCPVYLKAIGQPHPEKEPESQLEEELDG